MVSIAQTLKHSKIESVCTCFIISRIWNLSVRQEKGPVPSCLGKNETISCYFQRSQKHDMEKQVSNSMWKVESSQETTSQTISLALCGVSFSIVN